MILFRTSLHGLRDTSRNQPVNTVCYVIHKCKLKLYHAKKKPHVNTIQKCCCLLWIKAHLKWSDQNRKLFCGQMNQNLKFFLESPDVLQTKEPRDHLAFYQWTLQKPASLMVWGCIRVWCGQLEHLERLHQCSRAHKGFRAASTPI